MLSLDIERSCKSEKLRRSILNVIIILLPIQYCIAVISLILMFAGTIGTLWGLWWFSQSSLFHDVLRIFQHFWCNWHWDLFQPKTSTFSIHSLIWVHFKNEHYFSQPIFSLISYLKNALHNLVIELCIALKIF